MWPCIFFSFFCDLPFCAFTFLLITSAPVPLQEAKSETVSQQRMALLMPRSSAAAAARPRADVVIQVKGPGGYKQVCWDVAACCTLVVLGVHFLA